MKNAHALYTILVSLAVSPLTDAWIYASDNPTNVTLGNDRVTFILNKTAGLIDHVYFDGVNILGDPVDDSSAIGPYVDAYFPPKSDQYQPSGGPGETYEVVKGKDSDGTDYGGMIYTQINAEGVIGVTIQQSFFLRQNETSLHAFSRFAYQNETVPFLGEFPQLRTLFRPHGYFFTHLSATDDFYVPQPRPNPAIDSRYDLGIATQVQDTTWYIGNRTNDPFVEQVADYYTKYTLTATYRDQLVQGLFADGTNTPDNSTFGAWTVMNTKDTYYGGSTYSDLTVDGLLYNYIISNHHGDGVPNITNGYDRTFGPALFHLNRGALGGSLQDLRDQAKTLALNNFGSQFYDDISQYIPGYVTTAGRGSWKAQLSVPSCATNTIALLTAPGYNYQDNMADSLAYQYWVNVGSDGRAEIDRIKAGTYRLTVYADNVFGDYVHSQNITISSGQQTDSGTITWKPESAGTELFRLGVPDKSAGEYRHGYMGNDKPLHAPEYRIYWGAYDYINDFPNGVKFHINKSSEAQDWNYVHWSNFGGTLTRPDVVASATINNWTISFDLDQGQLASTNNATFTIQLAGVSTAAGNTNVYNNKTKYSDLPYNVVVNGNALQTWIIPYYHSSSCATRSGITCYTTSNKFHFPSKYLSANRTNEIILSLPYNATGISVLYDALRLEVQ